MRSKGNNRNTQTKQHEDKFKNQLNNKQDNTYKIKGKNSKTCNQVIRGNSGRFLLHMRHP